ncbi:MAG TPA: 2,3-diaminopropionate biosynthesis protein SbnA, partial [Pseudonocardia sp.]
TAVTLAPDMGERYLDTVYQTNWVHELYGNDALETADHTALTSVA